jgi:UDP:flavonoid glycosyltransferase YjiC (YdhE family)
MSRFLFATVPVTGHVNPGLALARELVVRGHDVRWVSTPRFRHAIEATGAQWIPFRRAMPFDETRIAELFASRPKSGLRQLRHDLRRVFVEIARGMVPDIEEELAREGCDVIVGDSAAVACRYVSERKGIPWAVYGVSTLPLPGPEVAPFGMNLMPSRTFLGKLRNRILNWSVDHLVFRAASRENTRVRRELGLPPLHGGIFDFSRRADVYLQGGAPSFEYPRTDLPPTLHFVGAAIPKIPCDWKPPAWWGELDQRRVVLVSQGAVNHEFDQLVRPAIRALAGEDVLVVVTTGGRPVDELAVNPLPANVRVERFIPYRALMPKVDVFVTNGGYDSIQIALAHAVPLVAIGKTEEQPEICNRVRWSGTGIGLKAVVPTEEQVRSAVMRVLDTPIYRARASAIAHEMSGLDFAVTGADLLEELAEEEEVERIA